MLTLEAPTPAMPLLRLRWRMAFSARRHFRCLGCVVDATPGETENMTFVVPYRLTLAADFHSKNEHVLSGVINL
ncbi:hypothetical protein TNCV_2484631 [Trichonephila clavipes]|uniref:Uncharacterized protein n=1 Tax=Trichonephila clavipes TaxID=2585209 RepID=A0A8X6VZA8_TRICX|nr:hypothetical protein TNCV_2484631 [Trichonephila clavipes]